MYLSDYLPPALIEYSNPPTNVVGAGIFLYYVIVSLFLVGHSLSFLRTRYEKFPQNVGRRSTKALVVFGFVSFVNLSRHMLNFLLKSYLFWRANKILYKPAELSDDDVVGPWRWMKESCLFEDFAKELVQDGPSSVVTQVALLVTWFWNVRLSQEAQLNGISSNALGPFVVLGQLLPISFTSTLFFIFIRLSPFQRRGGAGAQASVAPSPLSTQGFTSLPLLVTTAAFATIAINIPTFRDSPQLIPLVLATRLFLLLPYFSFSGIRPTDRINSAWAVGFGVIMINFRAAIGNGNVWDVLNALQSGPQSVKALGRDAVIALALAGWLKLEEVVL
ncbi:hypothetical protein B0J11DRAFT_534172 [Dendryphion nanum]|uniref:Uncharacterized protein n=1 Tax=Dendryphion nanum TaxID=256645 RepID=A0A9P9DJ75_9PLEO|nr:hypothetical protein B0J11DRAFT_534172 [Dendryphion nanum]